MLEDDAFNFFIPVAIATRKTVFFRFDNVYFVDCSVRNVTLKNSFNASFLTRFPRQSVTILFPVLFSLIIC